MDRLDRLTQRLVDDLDRQSEVPSGSTRCLAPSLLGEFATGSLDSQTRERVDIHLDACLACLNRVVELRDDLHGLAAPGDVSARLVTALNQLIGDQPEERSFWTHTAERVRRALVFRVPAWTVAAVVAAMLITWTVAYKFQQPDARIGWPANVSDPTSPGRLTPAERGVTRTVSGVVSSIRDATSSGVEAHVVSLKDASGATYVLFAWGRPTVGPGDAVEIDGIFTTVSQNAGLPVYQGMATQFRRAR